MEGRAETGLMSTHANVLSGTQEIHVLVSKAEQNKRNWIETVPF